MIRYIELALNVPLNKTFDYLIDTEAAPPPIGSRVLVPFGRQKKVGIVLQHKATSAIPQDKLKGIIQTIDDDAALDPQLMQLYHWCHHYYAHPIGEIIVGTLPKHLRTAPKRITYSMNADQSTQPKIEQINHASFLTLNTEQQSAYQHIQPDGFSINLLDGITGSGKTEVYLHLIRDMIKMKKQVLVLVPEIGLTPQTQKRFEQRFPGMVQTIHSQLSDKKKLLAWQQAHDGHAGIILGTRSAIFADIPHIGAIIIDEEHDHSFKQQEGFRYHARSVAIMRAKFSDIPIILGSATPSFDTLYNALHGKYKHIQLTSRAGGATLPTITTIDTTHATIQNGLSTDLIQTIHEHLDQKQQVLLFLNRRGYSQIIYCSCCGWSCQCKRCDARMTLHLKQNRVRCHHCNYQHAIPKQCSNCQHPDLIYLGQGTEKIEEEISALFHQYRIIRLDSDTMNNKTKLQTALDSIIENKVDIIIGTQMIAKGHHFPHCGMVAIINMDQCLFSPHYRHIEYGGQLLLQIAGRSGREQLPGKVYLQTACDQHPYLAPLLQHNYHEFYHLIMQERRSMQLPPFTAWAYLQARSIDEHKAIDFLHSIKQWIQQHSPTQCECHGPANAIMSRKAGWFQAQLCIQAPQKKQLQAMYTHLLQHAPLPPNDRYLRWHLDIDPMH